MSKFVIAALALAAMGYLGYRAMYGRQASVDEPVTAPTDKLQNVRAAAKRIEAQQDQRSDESQKAADSEHQ